MIPRLPSALAGARPRYGYGPRNYELAFASDVDLALYITAQKTPSKRDAEYRAWLRSIGMSDAQIDSQGQRVRAAIKLLAAGARDVQVLEIAGVCS